MSGPTNGPTPEASARVLPMPQPAPPGQQAVAATASQGLAAAVVDEHLNTDERPFGSWESRYPPAAKRSIRVDAAYVAVIFLLTLVAIVLVWRGVAYQWVAGDCTECGRATFTKFAYFYLGGQLGGILFGLKYLYNVVARGWWNIDRRLWRLFSPFLSGGLALAVGALVDSGIFGLTTKSTAGSTYFSLGFIAGYFADSALRKMKEIADTIFGSPGSHIGPPKA